MSSRIHPTAIIDPAARLGVDVSVGAYTVIGADVEIGDGCVIGSHVSILGPTRIGRNNRIHSHAALGDDPQDKKFKGERTELVVGDDNVIREFCTLHRGTGTGGGITRIGNDNWLLAYVHVAHDCVVGNHCVFSNNCALAGHVIVGDWVVLGGYTLLHQFCRVGDHAFTAMNAKINADVPPYVLVGGNYAVPRGINSEGLKRRGFDGDRVRAIKRAYRALYASGKSLADAKAELARLAEDAPDIAAMLAFIEGSERSLLR
ncbi:acyl-ACP--UDP-N-acetylglucosamine O-acyltransferase [Pseudofulvimonas gallinarii]|jgi:UDP-N-acetylglucosamine acyltransferase|uniref:Acyl-[acyl-carrier-protein]--UDP-N-acetylglucosamine O-acyltransferase n=1 Tax=Pseudofulvimonas gallinarii TaxID=634155 RepID=A0A4V3UU88_9GAMM|nr:acyl-ACP--UDP-N-acetylglucosamine O-acyltransferase [Pseudofulvimonas gallinarii]TCT00122.1 acyl-[acyl-carrier-protein]--UDP-N-acetylglucosamine O-acyltransferase [Pseudofulvimonas gallinarii]THD13591.1 acyl-[acyl-carrier-protein]--UDP-N-acetylglucosamine O-acyltransferase [Pseudofulvimonas gallinarii]